MKNNFWFWCLLAIVKLRPSFQLMINNDSLKSKEISLVNSSNIMGNYTTEPASEKRSSTDNKRLANRGYPKQSYMGKSRNNYRAESSANKMDRTIIGAIVIGCIFLFITLSITITIIIFCLKKNTVFVFQKSEQEDIRDCTYEDCLDSISYQSSIHCDDHHLSSCNSVPILRRHCRNQRNICEYFNRCPVELFYPMHYDKPYPIQFTHFRKPSHKRCQCLSTNPKSRNYTQTSNGTSLEVENEQLPWHKIHDGSVYKPLFKEIAIPNIQINNPNNIKVKLDLISQCREVIANPSTSIDKPCLDDKPLLQAFIENSVMPNDIKNSSTKIVLTPLGKSQTFNELNPLQTPKSSTSDDNQLTRSSKRLPKSRSNYESNAKSKRTL